MDVQNNLCMLLHLTNLLHIKLCIIPQYEIYQSKNAGKYCSGGDIFWDKLQNHTVMYKLSNILLKSQSQL